MEVRERKRRNKRDYGGKSKIKKERVTRKKRERRKKKIRTSVTFPTVGRKEERWREKN